jgi:P4 family phage/plasmid primase-like protien
MAKNQSTFLDSFPDHVFRYIDQATGSRPPVSSKEQREDLNIQGYEAYFTVNGFAGTTDNKKESCTSLNAFFIDIDGRKDAEEIAKIKEILDPTYVIETRNGFHVYWVLDEPIFKEEVSAEAWNEAVEKWERIEQNIVSNLNADPAVKDLTRILRIPETYYWKKSGDAYKRGVEHAPFKVKGRYAKRANTYSMEKVSDAFPMVVDGLPDFPKTPKGENMARYAEAEKTDFFNRVNEKYPIEQRPSFKALISGAEGTLPPNIVSRNMALLITGTLMRQAGWTKTDAIKHIKEVGWHGIEKERGGITEIENTLNSAFGGGYTYSYKNDIIAHNMTPQEQVLIQSAYAAVQKDRKELDKARFANYEYELFSRYPHLKKNEIGMIFNYQDGVYRALSDMEISNIIMMALYEDMLWGYRTKRNISDKIATLLSIIPDLVLTPDNGDIFNCKNGLLKLSTQELMSHTPDFVSLVQAPVGYDPNARADTWRECLESWMQGDESEEKKLLLQQFAGYLLSSSMEYSKALFLVGDGGNGKSTFADTIGMVLGNVATSRIDLEDLYSTFGLAGLIGKRLNIVEEVSGNYYQSHKLKKLVSGEELTINMKFKDQFKFKPEAKFIFAVNTMPRVDDSSTATERRIAVVLFNNNFRNNPNTALRFATGALAREMSGILNWMIEGLVKLRAAKRFVVTEEQKVALKEYRAENSSVEGFITECIEFKEGKVATARELYEEYKDYCQKDGRKWKSAIAFTKEMKEYGKRNGTFSFRERQNGHSPAEFEGVAVYSEWNEDTNYRMNRIQERANEQF